MPAAVLLAEPACPGRIAGLSSLERLLLCAEAAGLWPLLVLTTPKTGLSPDVRRLPAGCEVKERGSEEAARALERVAAENEQSIVAHCQLALDADYLRELSGASSGDCVVVGVRSGPPPDHAFAVALPGGVHTIGVASIPARELLHMCGAQPAPAVFAERVEAAAREGRLVPFCPERPHVARLVVSAADRFRATGDLVRLSGKASDGLVSRHLNRRLSGLVTRALVLTPIGPNHVTLLTLALGLGAAVVLSLGTESGFVAGTLLYQLSSALDGCDGEIARLKFLSSRFGEWADSAADHVSNLAFATGVSLGLQRRSGGDPLWLALGGFIVLAYLLIASSAFARMRGLRDAGHLNDFGSSLHRTLPAGSHRARVFRTLVAIARRDFYALLFFVLALLGAPESIPFLLALGAAGHVPVLLVRPRGAE